MRAFAAILSFATLCLAQSANLAFTSTPSSVTAGTPVVITYTAPELNEAVTITLRKGNPDDLQTISTLTSSATGGNYTWIPLSSLEDASDYALQLEQGDSVNYSGEFSLSGSNPASVSAAMAATSSLSSAEAALTSSYAQSASVASLQSVISSYNASLNSLTAASSASMTGAASSAGTGSALPRNTTMVSATLTASSSSSVSESGSSSSSSAGATSKGSSTTSSAAASSSTGAAAKAVSAISGASPLALVLCVVAGVFV